MRIPSMAIVRKLAEGGARTALLWPIIKTSVIFCTASVSAQSRQALTLPAGVSSKTVYGLQVATECVFGQ